VDFDRLWTNSVICLSDAPWAPPAGHEVLGALGRADYRFSLRSVRASRSSRQSHGEQVAVTKASPEMCTCCWPMTAPGKACWCTCLIHRV